MIKMKEIVTNIMKYFSMKASINKVLKMVMEN